MSTCSSSARTPLLGDGSLYRPSAVLREQRALLAIMLSYVAGCACIARSAGLETELRALWVFYTNLFDLLLLGVSVVLLAGCWLWLKCGTGQRRTLDALLVDDWRMPQRALLALPMVLLLPAFFAAMTTMKSAIPALDPYHWDASLSHWDALLHGGRQPWEWLQPVLGHRPITWVINLVYHPGYFAATFAVLLWQVFALRDRRLRLQFLLTFVLAWILLGTAGATLLSSVGPCYYGDFVAGPDPYGALMEYLRAAKGGDAVPWVTDVQQYLLAAHRTHAALGGVGISAMPSLHVSMASLYAFLGWRHGGFVRVLLAANFVVIWAGSVSLGWHYALDGYAAVLGTGLIWTAVGRRLSSAGEGAPVPRAHRHHGAL